MASLFRWSERRNKIRQALEPSNNWFTFVVEAFPSNKLIRRWNFNAMIAVATSNIFSPVGIDDEPESQASSVERARFGWLIGFEKLRTKGLCEEAVDRKTTRSIFEPSILPLFLVLFDWTYLLSQVDLLHLYDLIPSMKMKQHVQYYPLWLLDWTSEVNIGFSYYFEYNPCCFPLINIRAIHAITRRINTLSRHSRHRYHYHRCCRTLTSNHLVLLTWDNWDQLSHVYNIKSWLMGWTDSHLEWLTVQPINHFSRLLVISSHVLLK